MLAGHDEDCKASAQQQLVLSLFDLFYQIGSRTY